METETRPSGEESEIRDIASLSYDLTKVVITDVRPVLEFL